MKYLVLIGDGMADFPLESHGGRTPLELAPTPAMDELARSGQLGLYAPIPEGYPPGSDIGNLSLFGYDPTTTFSGRAPLEAANQGIALAPGDVAFRCNLVTLNDGVMADFCAGHISTEEARELIAALNDACRDPRVDFHAGVSYRHLAVFKSDGAPPGDLLALSCTPPHDIIGQVYAEHLPKGNGADALIDYMTFSQPVLADHPVNRDRARRGKPPATSIWLWGQGCAPSMATYGDRFGLTGSVISAVDLVKGIGICAGLESIDVPGATGYLDTNYEGKVAAAREALAEQGICFLHVEAPDEASHEGRLELKIQAIQDFDRRVVAPCLQHFAGRDVRILVAPDHVTALGTRTHAGGPVPFAYAGPGVPSNGGAAFSERAAEATGLRIARGAELLPRILARSPGGCA